MQKTTIISIVISIVALAVSILLYLKPRERGAYVRTKDVFEQFDMTRERKANFESTANIRKHLLDSIELNLKMMAGELRTAAKKDVQKIQLFEYNRQEYLKKKQELDEDNQTLSANYDQEIWTRLSQYAKDFGTERHVSFLYGATGDGTIMYADEKLDVTAEFIQYINSKYKGIR